MTDDEREAFVRARELPWTDCAFLLARLDAARARAAALEAEYHRLRDALCRVYALAANVDCVVVASTSRLPHAEKGEGT